MTLRVSLITAFLATLAFPRNATAQVLAPPSITKTFGAPTIVVGSQTTLSFTLTNPNTSTALTGVAFTDVFPAGLVIATPNGISLTGCSTGGGGTAVAGTSTVNWGAVILTASESCTITINVVGTAPGTINNTTSAVTSFDTGPGNTASATLLVQEPGGAPTLGTWSLTLLTLLLAAAALRVMPR
jgi:hypothetical protein